MQKTASAPAECRFTLLSMMARGGRDVRPQEANPNLTESHKNFFTFTKRLHKQATLYSAGHKYALFLAARVGSYPTGILLGVGVFI